MRRSIGAILWVQELWTTAGFDTGEAHCSMNTGNTMVKDGKVTTLSASLKNMIMTVGTPRLCSVGSCGTQINAMPALPASSDPQCHAQTLPWQHAALPLGLHVGLWWISSAPPPCRCSASLLSACSAFSPYTRWALNISSQLKRKRSSGSVGCCCLS